MYFEFPDLELFEVLILCESFVSLCSFANFLFFSEAEVFILNIFLFELEIFSLLKS